MPYVLGIDLTSTEVTAAVSRFTGSTWLDPEPIDLDGALVARDLMRRMGDNVALIVDGYGWHPHTLLARVAAWAAEQITEWEGEPPEHVTLSHPPAWGPFRIELFQDSLWRAGLPGVGLLPAPIVVVQDLPGTTHGVIALEEEDFAASVVRRSSSGQLTLLDSASPAWPLGHLDPGGAAYAADVMMRTVRRAGVRLDGLVAVGPVPKEVLDRFGVPVIRHMEPVAAGTARFAIPLPPPVESVESIEPPRPPVRISKLRLPRRRAAPSKSAWLVHARGFTFL